MARIGASRDVPRLGGGPLAARGPGTYLEGAMADADILPVPTSSRFARLVERLRSSAGLIAAIAGAITGLWTIYEKVRSDARQYTAASYETLAPQINQMTEVLKQLEQENHEMRQALTAQAGNLRRERPAAAKAGSKTAQRPPVATAPAARPPGAPPAPAPAPGAAPAPEAPAPGAAAPGAAPAPTAQTEPAAEDPLGQLIGTVNRTREAIGTLRRVPESFQQVLDRQK
jgi:hypothetical protein